MFGYPSARGHALRASQALHRPHVEDSLNRRAMLGKDLNEGAYVESQSGTLTLPRGAIITRIAPTGAVVLIGAGEGGRAALP